MQKVRLREKTLPGCQTELDATYNQNGDLVLDGYDLGSRVKELMGDSDYEYTLTIPKEHLKDLLLVLLQDRYDPDGVPFTGTGEVQRLCNRHGISCTFWSWA